MDLMDPKLFDDLLGILGESPLFTEHGSFIYYIFFRYFREMLRQRHVLCDLDQSTCR